MFEPRPTHDDKPRNDKNCERRQARARLVMFELAVLIANLVGEDSRKDATPPT